MPVLSNAKHERFAQELAKGKSADEAYVIAGYKANHGNAGTLKAKQVIRDRVADILERAATRVEVTVQSLLDEAEQVRVAAMVSGQLSAAVSAIREKGVLAGVRVEKRETMNRRAEDLTDDELAYIAISGGSNTPEKTDSPAKSH